MVMFTISHCDNIDTCKYALRISESIFSHYRGPLPLFTGSNIFENWVSLQCDVVAQSKSSSVFLSNALFLVQIPSLKFIKASENCC